MRILFDMQAAQSSYQRGIGRYALSSIEAIVRNNSCHEIYVLLNNNIESGKKEIYKELSRYLPANNIIFFSAPVGLSILNFPSNAKLRAARLIYLRVIKQLSPAVIHIFAPFTSSHDDSVSCIQESHDIPISITLYDLIPHIMPEHYLVSPSIKNWYEAHFLELSNSDLLLAISESSRKEAIDYLNVNQDMVVNVSCDADKYFTEAKTDSNVFVKLKTRFKIKSKFIAYVSYTDYRKNNYNLITAFSLLSKKLRDGLQLVVICKIDELTMHLYLNHAKKCGLRNNDVIFTNFITDEELVSFYKNCNLFVFPSLHEGFGLPVLEAMRCGAAVIASNCTSMPEIIGDNAFTFDPYNPKSIADKIEKSLLDEIFYKKLLQNSRVQEKKFSWDHVAKESLAALEKLANRFDRLASDKIINTPENLEAFLNNILSALDGHDLTDNDLASIAKAINENERAFSTHLECQLLLDVSVFRSLDAGTGISRVVKKLSKNLEKLREKYLVRAVYDNGAGYNYAPRQVCVDLEIDEYRPDTPVDINASDIFLGLDLHLEIKKSTIEFLEFHKLRGLKVYFLLYDLVPIKFKDYHSEIFYDLFHNWLEQVIKASTALITISKTVLDESKKYIEKEFQKTLKARPFPLKYFFFHLGTDLKREEGLDKTKQNKKITFLMVGWIDHRKGHIDVINALSILWNLGFDVELVICGRINVGSELILDKIYSHEEYDKRLFFLGQVNDQGLKELYARSDALIAASLDEGFCIPIVEASSMGLPLLLRDIPIFREVASDYAYYFRNLSAEFIAEDLHKWIDLYSVNAHPLSDRMPFLTWQESALQLASIVMPD